MSVLDVKKTFGNLEREQLTALARTSEAAERYDDMCEVMKELVQTAVGSGSKGDLSVEERNLLSVAFKNVVGARRASIRTLAESNPYNNEYKLQLQAELTEICDRILDILKTSLIQEGEENEAQVFYLKMGADYYRYLAECVEQKDYPEQAQEYYRQAFDIAKTKLAPTHPIRLGLALNYSVCLYEIAKKQTEACTLAKTAFDDAISQLDKLEESDYKDSTLIMQLLRDNLTLWTATNEDDDEN